MSFKDLESEYERLRSELEKAYAAPVWNSGLIDRIANALARIERTLMRLSASVGMPALAANSSKTRQSDMHHG